MTAMEEDDFCVETCDNASVGLLSGPTTREQLYLKDFILNFESLPVLLDSSCSVYKNNVKRTEALGKLLSIYKNIKEDATLDDVRKKINSLRSNYRKELKKIVESKRSGAGSDDIYKPKSWVFQLLHFLNKMEQPINPSTSSVSEGRREVVRQQGDFEAQVSGSSGSFSSINGPPLPKQRKKGPIAKQNELLDKACSFLSQSVNSQQDNTHVNPTAIYWTEKLETLDRTQRLLAEKFINDILFEAELGNLERSSVQINLSLRDEIISPSPVPSPVYTVHPPSPSPTYSNASLSNAQTNSPYTSTPAPVRRALNLSDDSTPSVITGFPKQLLVTRTSQLRQNINNNRIAVYTSTYEEDTEDDCTDFICTNFKGG